MQEPKQQLVALFKQIQQGDKHAFDQFFLLYHHQLVAFAQQYLKQTEDAEEAVSELFVKIWLKRNSFSEVLHPEVYLFVAVKNACLNLIRSRKKRDLLFPMRNDDEIIATEGVNQTRIEEKELHKILDQAIANLPQQRRLIFKLIKENGLKTKDVAKILSISNRTVENQLYKAVKTLAMVLSEYLGYHPQQALAKKQATSSARLLFFF
jgi:RNA polymerase sigma-70 factor (family 1)